MHDKARGKTEISEFLKLSEHLPVIDVRSPGEFEKGHIPGAVNIPLLSNEEREKVGIAFKKSGRADAVTAGMEIVGPRASEKLRDAFALSGGGKLLLYCWRGGMRSEAMAWLFSAAGIATEVLDGGYKSYRNHILNTLSEKRKMIILGGLTGSGKTDILRFLEMNNEPVIDLEDLARHRGSAFGSLGQGKQPSSEHFANLLYSEWVKTAGLEPVWAEDESRNIGSVFMPDNFYANMQQNPVVVLMIPSEIRVINLVREYSAFPPENLKAAMMRISRRLGGERTNEALRAIDSGNFKRAAEIVLDYYDKAYLFGLRNKPPGMVHYVETDTADVTANALKVLQLKDKMESSGL